ncbi:MAG TPA: hypothetical protein PJ982_01510 [Lacipirellulaceae bacterium]|nr:hypothetical protein [Lacipirellulaceae bacterium]
MSSLRPLATIALLAAVGVFLYMKINESEPKLPPELAQWSTSELEVGGDFEAPLPTFGAAPAASAAQAVGGDALFYAAAAAAPSCRGWPRRRGWMPRRRPARPIPRP